MRSPGASEAFPMGTEDSGSSIGPRHPFGADECASTRIDHAPEFLCEHRSADGVLGTLGRYHAGERVMQERDFRQPAPTRVDAVGVKTVDRVVRHLASMQISAAAPPQSRQCAVLPKSDVDDACIRSDER
jgi:hypothetical protein